MLTLCPRDWPNCLFVPTPMLSVYVQHNRRGELWFRSAENEHKAFYGCLTLQTNGGLPGRESEFHTPGAQKNQIRSKINFPNCSEFTNFESLYFLNSCFCLPIIRLILALNRSNGLFVDLSMHSFIYRIQSRRHRQRKDFGWFCWYLEGILVNPSLQKTKDEAG